MPGHEGHGQQHGKSQTFETGQELAGMPLPEQRHDQAQSRGRRHRRPGGPGRPFSGPQSPSRLPGREHGQTGRPLRQQGIQYQRPLRCHTSSEGPRLAFFTRNAKRPQNPAARRPGAAGKLSSMSEQKRLCGRPSPPQRRSLSAFFSASRYRRSTSRRAHFLSSAATMCQGA